MSDRAPTAARGPQPEPAPSAPDRSTGASDDIAVVGLTGRYPGSPDLDAFWDNLRRRRSPACTRSRPTAGTGASTSTRTAAPPSAPTAAGADSSTTSTEFDPAFFADPAQGRGRDGPAGAAVPGGLLDTAAGRRLPRRAAREQRTGVFVGTMYGAYGRIASRERLAARALRRRPLGVLVDREPRLVHLRPAAGRAWRSTPRARRR